MTQKYTIHVPTSVPEIGSIKIVGNDTHILGIGIDSSASTSDPAIVVPAHMQLCQQELQDFVQGKRKTFTVQKHFLYLSSSDASLKPTPFQQQVWQALLNIPFGSTQTYSQLAATVGNPTAYRAVGNANGKNPYCIIVPCHRVLAKDGLGGYSGGLHVKKWLLELEKGK